MAFELELSYLVERGLTMNDCIAHFGVSLTEDAHAAHAKKEYADSSNGRINVDDKTLVSPSDDGKFVMGWFWVGNEDLDDL